MVASREERPGFIFAKSRASTARIVGLHGLPRRTISKCKRSFARR